MVTVRAIFGMPPGEFLQALATVLLGIASVVVTGFVILRRRRKQEKDRVKEILHFRTPEITSSPEILSRHAEEFTPRRVYTAGGGKVRSAVGFGLANTILIEGDDGCALIDTLESGGAMREAMEEFGQVLDEKPIRAIIITHSHPDHTGGAQAVLKRFPSATVYAHESLFATASSTSALGATVLARAYRQFGTYLPAGELICSGIGPFWRFGKDFGPAPRDKVQLVKGDGMTVEVAKDLVLKLIHAPGESQDQMAVWWEKERVLFPADNIYKSFPNLYAVRGEKRDLAQWCSVLDGFLRLRPVSLVPCHGRPISPETESAAKDLLTCYRDAIQFVQDQTTRLINKGLPSSSVGLRLRRLPASLRSHPYLQEFYGTAEWSAKAVYSGRNGWFGGDISQLRLQLSREERSEQFLSLCGGAEKALAEAVDASKKSSSSPDDLRWCLRLLEAVELGAKKRAEAEEARTLSVRCLRLLATKETSANGRNYLFTCAAEKEAGLSPGGIKPEEEMVKKRLSTIPMGDLFSSMPLMLDAQKAEEEGAEEKARFDFTDTGEKITLKLNGCVMDCSVKQKRSEEADSDYSDPDLTLHLETTSAVWRSIASKQKHPLRAWISGGIKFKKGGVFGLGRLMGYLDRGGE